VVFPTPIFGDPRADVKGGAPKLRTVEGRH
jgi:hypothetical protein